jgi:hypothetical protein
MILSDAVLIGAILGIWLSLGSCCEVLKGMSDGDDWAKRYLQRELMDLEIWNLITQDSRLRNWVFGNSILVY